MNLTASIRKRNGRRVASFRGFDAYDDALAALRLMGMLAEPHATYDDKLCIAWAIVFCDAKDASRQGFDLLADCIWELYGMDIAGNHAGECKGKRIIDWDSDADRIAASIRQVYGVSWEQFARETSFRDACAMIGLLPRDTPMGTAIYYRTAEPPAPNGKNGDQIAEFNRIKAHYAIEQDVLAASNDKMADFFSSLKVMANG